jgi:phosphinothricin acetyltransferase
MDSVEQNMIPFSIRVLEKKDRNAVLEIFRAGVDSMEATFETDASLENWEKIHLPHSQFVLVDEKEIIIGWCGLLYVSDKPCYNGIAETSIYLSPHYQGKGLGKILLEKLILDSQEQGINTLQAQVFTENIKSLKLHERLGFREVGKREKLGQIEGIWKDVLLLERKKNRN